MHLLIIGAHLIVLFPQSVLFHGFYFSALEELALSVRAQTVHSLRRHFTLSSFRLLGYGIDSDFLVTVLSLIGPVLLSVSSGIAESIDQDVQLVGARIGLIKLKRSMCVKILLPFLI